MVCVPEFDEGAMAKAGLIFHTSEVLPTLQCACGRQRIERRQPNPSLMIDIQKEISKQDVGGSEIYLGMQHVTPQPSAACVLAGRKRRNQRLSVFCFENIGEPGASAHNRTGNANPGI